MEAVTLSQWCSTSDSPRYPKNALSPITPPFFLIARFCPNPPQPTLRIEHFALRTSPCPGFVSCWCLFTTAPDAVKEFCSCDPKICTGLRFRGPTMQAGCLVRLSLCTVLYSMSPAPEFSPSSGTRMERFILRVPLKCSLTVFPWVSSFPYAHFPLFPPLLALLALVYGLPKVL